MLDNKFVMNWKAAISTITGVGTILGGLWAIDTHYASAADISQVKQSLEVQIQSNQRNVDDKFLKLRKDQMEDEIFKLDIKKQTQKGKLTPYDQALYERYLRQYQIMNDQQRELDHKLPPKPPVVINK